MCARKYIFGKPSHTVYITTLDNKHYDLKREYKRKMKQKSIRKKNEIRSENNSKKKNETIEDTSIKTFNEFYFSLLAIFASVSYVALVGLIYIV